MRKELCRRLVAITLLICASYRYARPAYALLHTYFIDFLIRHLVLGLELAIYSVFLLFVARAIWDKREWARALGILAAGLWCLNSLQHDLPLYEYFQPPAPAWIVGVFVFGGASLLALCLWQPFDYPKPLTMHAPAPAV